MLTVPNVTLYLSREMLVWCVHLSAVLVIFFSSIFILGIDAAHHGWEHHSVVPVTGLVMPWTDWLLSMLCLDKILGLEAEMSQAWTSHMLHETKISTFQRLTKALDYWWKGPEYLKKILTKCSLFYLLVISVFQTRIFFA